MDGSKALVTGLQVANIIPILCRFFVNATIREMNILLAFVEDYMRKKIH